MNRMDVDSGSLIGPGRSLFGSAVNDAVHDKGRRGVCGIDGVLSYSGKPGNFQRGIRKGGRSIFERMVHFGGDIEDDDGRMIGPIRRGRRFAIAVADGQLYGSDIRSEPYPSSSTFYNMSKVSNRSNFTANRFSRRDSNTPSSDDRWLHDKFDGDPSLFPGSKVFVRNLPSSTTADRLIRLFSLVGHVVSVKVDNGPLTTALINFRFRESGQKCVEEMNGKVFWGAKLKIAIVEDTLKNKYEKDQLKMESESYDLAIEQEIAAYGRQSRRKPDKPLSFLPSVQKRISIFDRMT